MFKVDMSSFVIVYKYNHNKRMATHGLCNETYTMIPIYTYDCINKSRRET